MVGINGAGGVMVAASNGLRRCIFTADALVVSLGTRGVREAADGWRPARFGGGFISTYFCVSQERSEQRADSRRQERFNHRMVGKLR